MSAIDELQMLADMVRRAKEALYGIDHANRTALDAVPCWSVRFEETLDGLRVASKAINRAIETAKKAHDV